MLKIENVSVYTEKKEKILEDVNAKFSKNSFSLILGPNAAGKTTLAEVISGSGNFTVNGRIYFENKNITKKELNERAKLGILILFQNPVEIPGVKIFDFLYCAYKEVKDKNICVWDFQELLLKVLNKLKLSEDFLHRNINEGFSGGEKKRFEILQMLLFKPKVVILDEIDSGLDIDSVKEIFKIIKDYKEKEKATVIIISHSSEILKYIDPDQVLLIQDKKLLKHGDSKLAKKIIKEGYAKNEESF